MVEELGVVNRPEDIGFYSGLVVSGLPFLLTSRKTDIQSRIAPLQSPSYSQSTNGGSYQVSVRGVRLSPTCSPAQAV